MVVTINNQIRAQVRKMRAMMALLEAGKELASYQEGREALSLLQAGLTTCQKEITNLLAQKRALMAAKAAKAAKAAAKLAAAEAAKVRAAQALLAQAKGLCASPAQRAMDNWVKAQDKKAKTNFQELVKEVGYKMWLTKKQQEMLQQQAASAAASSRVKPAMVWAMARTIKADAAKAAKAYEAAKAAKAAKVAARAEAKAKAKRPVMAWGAYPTSPKGFMFKGAKRPYWAAG